MQQRSLVRGKSPWVRHGAKRQMLARDNHSISLKKNQNKTKNKQPKSPKNKKTQWCGKTTWRYRSLRSTAATPTPRAGGALGATGTAASSWLTPGSQNRTQQRRSSLQPGFATSLPVPGAAQHQPESIRVRQRRIRGADGAYLHSDYNEPCEGGEAKSIAGGPRSQGWGQLHTS